MPASTANANIARHLSLMVERQPDQAALKIPRGRTATGEIDYLALTYHELASEVAAWRARLIASGVRRADRTLMMVRPGLPLIASAFALFQIGAVPVIIDPGMGLRHFLACVARTRPRVLVGIPFAQIVSRLFRGTFRSIETRVAASGSLVARLAARESQISNLKSQNTPRDSSPNRTNSPANSEILDLRSEIVAASAATTATAATDLAAIVFTSGSTGAPKGVCYEHGMFEAQVSLIREIYGIVPGEIDLPMLPIFALFNPALGMTTIVPEIDPRRPAEVDPAKIVQAILQEKVTNSFGSPTLWRKIGDHCREHRIELPSLRRVLCAGAPVPASLWAGAASWLTGGRLHSPYGATEALPVSSVTADEIDPASLRGACVGHPVREMEVKIIGISDAPIATLADVRELPRGEIGEIIVHGPVVTKTYDALPEATALAKIQTPEIKSPTPVEAKSAHSSDDLIGHWSLDTGHSAPRPSGAWHRMGDCGYLDAEGRLWFCGRKAERVQTLQGTMHTELCEQVFRTHPRVARCALIGLGEPGRQSPAIVVETKNLHPTACRALTQELRALALQHVSTAAIERFYFRSRFPVDVRHNAKIHRLKLAKWALSARHFQAESSPGSFSK